jgi:hypothetical protein
VVTGWFSDREIALGKAVSYTFKVLMKEASLNEVVILRVKHQKATTLPRYSKKMMGKKT